MIDIYDLIEELFPICRSITGDGVRRTLELVKKRIPIQIHEVKSGTQCFDWTIPDEWNPREAWIKDPAGKKIADFAENNLHLLGYSIPFKGKISLDELRGHLYSDPGRPDAIPYNTSYYERRWGFCLSHRQLGSLAPGEYEVYIDTTLEPGSLTYADMLVKGKTEKEIFFSCYVCHPSMADDSISGVALCTALCDYLLKRSGNYYSYRFIFVPETIGAICYLARNGGEMKRNVYCGMTVTCVGDEVEFNYKRTRSGKHALDRIVENILKHSGEKYKVHDFFLPGSDERQYSSPGFKLETGSLMRSFYGLPNYHSSADNLDFVTRRGIEGSYEIYRRILEAVEADFKYLNKMPYCEPFLSKYKLYDTLGAQVGSGSDYKKKILSLLNYSDGEHSLIDVAEKSSSCISDLIALVKLLKEKNLLE